MSFSDFVRDRPIVETPAHLHKKHNLIIIRDRLSVCSGYIQQGIA
jgi:hypothetical protein